MPPDLRATASKCRNITDQALKQNAHGIYLSVLRLAIKDLPLEEQSVITDAYANRDFLRLLQWTDSYSRVEHTCGLDAFKASQLVALIKKYPFPAKNLKPLAREKAVGKFWDAERRCRRYNLRFRRLNTTGAYSPVATQLNKMRAWIRYVLGDKPDMSSIYSHCSFGPGASVGVNGQSTNLARKFLAQDWTVTPLALPYALTALAHLPLVWELIRAPDEKFVCYDVDVLRDRLVARTRLVNNNNVTFVPKTTMVDRTIAVEPLLNGYLQKGIDIYMRQCLKRVGLDLAHQELNQHLAYLGSLPGVSDPYATIDLSSASDSVSSELVKYLLPSNWYDLLNRTRAGVGQLDDEQFVYEKFASMGNGFCFPLETLIFASACAVVDRTNDFSVYGDDIIVKQTHAAEVIKILRYMGFRENPDKTFVKGPFRESCGADWYEGQNIRPLTLDYHLDSVEAIIKFHNSSLRQPLWVDYFSEIREYLKSLIPTHVRLVRPFIGTVESAFEVSLDEFMSSPFAKWNRKLFTWSWLETCTHSVPDRQVQRDERYSTVLMMAALRFSPSSCPFSYRRKTTRTFRRMSYSAAVNTWLPGDNSSPTESSDITSVLYSKFVVRTSGGLTTEKPK